LSGLKLAAGILRNGTEQVGASTQNAVLIINAPEEPDYPELLNIVEAVWLEEGRDVSQWRIARHVSVSQDSQITVRWIRLTAERGADTISTQVDIEEFRAQKRRTLDPYKLPAIQGTVLSDRTGLTFTIPANSLKVNRVYKLYVTASIGQIQLTNSFRIRAVL
jgi:hypothetical protein